MIVRVRKAGYNNHGDPIAGEPERLTIVDAYAFPRETSDLADRGRNGVIDARTLHAPYGTEILHSDEIEVDGVLFQVDGVAGDWKNPWTQWEAGTEVALVRAAG